MWLPWPTQRGILRGVGPSKPIPMKTFACQSCGQPVFFENVHCTRCGAPLGFLPDRLQLSALFYIGDGIWMAPLETGPMHERPPGLLDRLFHARAHPAATRSTAGHYRKCVNYAEHNVCNWMVPAESPDEFCPACAPNRTIPNLSRPGNWEKWSRIEHGKHRMVYGLLRLGLPFETKWQNPGQGLAFDFLCSRDALGDKPVITGHLDGLITINLDEADAALRERVRLDMDERYRTLVGHFRHEIGHYYWDLLIRDRGGLDAFRALFGDERVDYGSALTSYHSFGPPPDWESRFITPYASAHPWEDWAETWAHYMHIVDTLETAEHFGITVEWPQPDGGLAIADPNFDPYDLSRFEPIIEHWLPLTFAINSINRSMGQQDLYPFVLSQPALDKMAFVHRTIIAN